MTTTHLSPTVPDDRPAHRPAGPLTKIVRLHFADPLRLLVVPISILATTTAVCVVIMLLILSFSSGDPAVISEGFRYNQAPLWCFGGYFVSVGVMAYARTMPFAMGMGATRRQYWTGTAIALLLEALYIGVAMTVFLALEKATGHWFTGTHMFDVYVMGNGSYRDIFLMGFGISMLMLFVGTMFASVFVRWNTRGVLLVVVGIVATLLLLAWGSLTLGIDVLGFFATDIVAKIALLMVVLGAISSAGSWLVLRRAPVGR
ncbi:hypothetical protein [Arthrobacter sp. JSM 101049]|uniref:hypothetical protein n=1 Tax=Arthrobacter sp. JSM 101049 TaxID=929097 RepID=UPI00356B05C7